MRQLKLNDKCNHDTLINFGFKKYGMDYKMFIPLYKKNDETLIEYEIVISLADKHIQHTVVDVCNDSLYMAYYDQNQFGTNIILEKVESAIDKILNDLADKDIITKGCLDIE